MSTIFSFLMVSLKVRFISLWTKYKKSIKKFDKKGWMEYTYIAYKTFFVFISSVLLAEEFFKLYRMSGGSMFKLSYLQHRIKEFIQLEVLFLFHVSFLSIFMKCSKEIWIFIWWFIYEYMVNDKKSALNKNKTLSSLSPKLCFLKGSE